MCACAIVCEKIASDDYARERKREKAKRHQLYLASHWERKRERDGVRGRGRELERERERRAPTLPCAHPSLIEELEANLRRGQHARLPVNLHGKRQLGGDGGEKEREGEREKARERGHKRESE